jgi:hypothetical protein
MEDAPICVAADDAIALEDEGACCFGDSVCEGSMLVGILESGIGETEVYGKESILFDFSYGARPHLLMLAVDSKSLEGELTTDINSYSIVMGCECGPTTTLDFVVV